MNTLEKHLYLYRLCQCSKYYRALVFFSNNSHHHGLRERAVAVHGGAGVEHGVEHAALCALGQHLVEVDVAVDVGERHVVVGRDVAGVVRHVGVAAGGDLLEDRVEGRVDEAGVQTAPGNRRTVLV